MNHGKLHPPRIEPVGEGVSRPLWSVMIPAFNSAHYLRQTLDSVLAQDPGPEQMQIEVMDDCSTEDDPEAVVRECGNGRVFFYRKPVHEGMAANFNTCIRRSRGQLVHIIHSDDYVLPEFYRRLADVAEHHPKAALIASRSFLVDHENVIIGVTERLPELEAGAQVVDSFFYRTPIQAPGVVLRRAFYESHGGFLLDLPYVLDCEMWARAISLAGGVVTAEVLSCYRIFEANDSARKARTAENLAAVELLNTLFADRHPGFDRRQGLHRLLNMALAQAERYANANDAVAAAANLAYWKASAPMQLRVRRAAGKLADGIFR
jgi:glycosyltransferase involved in cell wall biosynthesis